MNVSLNWLKTHLDISDYSLEKIDDLLTFAGIEVEGVSQSGVPSDKVVVAQIKSAEQHPDADRLKVCQVDAGEGELRQIVCGAQNYSVGDKVPCALPGADLGNGFLIKEGKLRGVASLGMLCGADEIGLVSEEDGLFILPADSAIGTKLVELFPSDTIIEVEVTPNRPDLLSHLGMARELAALAKVERSQLEIPSAETTPAGDDIVLSQPAQGPYYTAQKISNVKVADSPSWLKERLEAIGLRPINNVVDITNYVLHELGHPLHAFDATKVNGALDIRLAADGEKFAALDENDYQLESSDLVISDASGQVLALAGIMGGADSGVTETTTDVILESAYFTPSEIRRTSRRLNLSSDSSYRFERGSDPQAVLNASAYAAKLICEIAGGQLDGATQVAGEAPVLTQPVTLDVAKLDQLMGGSITLAEAEAILISLGLEKGEDNQWIIPSFRLDLQRHIDLVEEIARVHGLDKVESRYTGTFVDESPVDKAYDAQMALRYKLASLGFYEAQTIKLIAEKSLDATVAQLGDALPQRPLQDGDLVKVALPLSEDHAIMRPSLTPGLVATAARNLRQGAKALRFFEMGRQFRNMGGGKAKDLEADSLAILISGELQPASWANTKPSLADLADAKAIVAQLLPQQDVQINKRDRDGFILAGDVLADGKPIGAIAQLKPSRCRELGTELPIYVLELDLKKLQQLTSEDSPVNPLPQFPGSARDSAIEAPLSLANGEIEKVLGKYKEPLLVEFRCTDIFADPSGEKIAADKKSMTYSFMYRSDKGTLKQKEVDQAHQKLLDHLTKSLPISFR